MFSQRVVTLLVTALSVSSSCLAAQEATAVSNKESASSMATPSLASPLIGAPVKTGFFFDSSSTNQGAQASRSLTNPAEPALADTASREMLLSVLALGVLIVRRRSTDRYWA
jgi:hypothetical protein